MRTEPPAAIRATLLRTMRCLTDAQLWAPTAADSHEVRECRRALCLLYHALGAPKPLPPRMALWARWGAWWAARQGRKISEVGNH